MTHGAPLWADTVDQVEWLTRHRKRTNRRRIFSPAMVDELVRMIGRRTVREMADRLHLAYHQIVQKLNALGYSIKRDVHDPLGRNVLQASRIIGVPYDWLRKEIRAGRVAAIRLCHKHYFLRWAEIKRVGRKMQAHRDHRDRLLERIQEPTISKKQFDRMIGLSEIQTQRYLKGGIVRAWKVPMLYAMGAHPDRWEWLVSKADAQRVTRLRAEGKLRLRKKAFRKIVDVQNQKVLQLRRDRRLGLHPELKHRMSCVIPGCYSVAAVAAQAGLSDTEVYAHIRLGRLVVESRQVGQRTYRAVRPEALPAYLAWTRQSRSAKCGPLHPRAREAELVLASGYLTIQEALRRYPDLTYATLQAAVARGRIPSTHIGRRIALKQKDVRRYVKLRRRWKERQAHAH